MHLNPDFFKKIDTPEGPANFTFWKNLCTEAESYRGSWEKILLVLRPDAIGDFILFSPALAGLRKHFHDHLVVLIGIPEVCELATAFRLADHTIPWNRSAYERRGRYWRSFLLKLAQTTPVDTLFYPCISREENADEMVAVIRAREKIGVRSDGCNITVEKALHNEALYSRILDIGKAGGHETIRNRRILKLLGLKPAPVSFLNHEHPTILAFMRKKGIEKPFLLLAPGSRVETKSWPRKRFQTVLDWHLANTSAQVVIAGGPGDVRKAEKLRTECCAPDRVFSFAGQLNLVHSVAITGHASLFIGNDSGLAHIAAAQNIPGHVIMGGAHYGRFFPYPDGHSLHVHTFRLPCFGCDWKCVRTRPECVQRTKIPEEALTKTLKFLSSTSRKPVTIEEHVTHALPHQLNYRDISQNRHQRS